MHIHSPSLMTGLVENYTNSAADSTDEVVQGATTKLNIFILFLLFILSLATNGFLVAKIVTDKRLQTSINVLLMVHNILNIVLCFLTLLPAAIILTAKITSVHHNVCQIGISGYLLVNYLSITNLACIAIDRWRTISSSKYTLQIKHIVIGQVIYFAVAVTFALPWTEWLNGRNSIVGFSHGFLKCRVMYRPHTQINPVIISIIVIRYLVFLVVPTLVIGFCFARIFSRITGRWTSVGPILHAPDGVPVGCYLKSANTNALLISAFITLRFPELIYLGIHTNSKSKNNIHAQRFVAYITWFESVLFPVICIMRNTTLLRRVTSTACCNFIIALLSSKKEKRKRQYEVQQTSGMDHWISNPSQASNETAMASVSESTSTVRSSSPTWSKITQPIAAWTSGDPITIF